MASMIMLVSWEVWKECNARVSVARIVCKIKEEAWLWSLAGAKKN
jgi:hypothetical protein